MSIVSYPEPQSIPGNRPQPSPAIPPDLAEDLQGHAMGVAHETTMGLEHLAMARRLDRQGDELVKELKDDLKGSIANCRGVERGIVALLAGREVDGAALAALVASVIAQLSGCLDILADVHQNDAEEGRHWAQEAPVHVDAARQEGREISRLIDRELD